MMIKKILIIAIPALLILLSLFFSISAYLNYRDNYVSIPVASHNLMQRTLIEENDLTYVNVPKAYLNDDVYTKNADIIGKFVKLSYSLPKGSLIYKASLEKEIKDLSTTLLLEGEVNYDIYTGEVKINAGSLGVNMYVDIYLTIKNNEVTISDLLLEGCRITGLYDNQGRQIMSYDTDSRVMIVSLAVQRDAVNLLNKALMIGNISVLSNSESYDPNNRCRLNEESAVLQYLQ